MTYLRIVIPFHFSFAHDLFGKPVPTFPDQAPDLLTWSKPPCP
jgi:hypothetical protein